MIEPQPPRHTGRSIVAVLIGMVVAIILTIVTDVLLHAVGVFPPLGQSMVGYDGALLLATIYRTLYGVAGCYITARLAPNRPMMHALIGGFIGLAVSTAGAIVTWNKGPAFGPHWYPVALTSCSRCPPPGSAADSASCNSVSRKLLHPLAASHTSITSAPRASL